MKTMNICGGKSCCPRLVMERTNGKLKFHIIDGNVKIILDSETARNLALAIFKEIEK